MNPARIAARSCRTTRPSARTGVNSRATVSRGAVPSSTRTGPASAAARAPTWCTRMWSR